MTAQEVLSRIERDVALLRKMLGPEQKKNGQAKVPVLKSFYTEKEAIAEKSRIEAAFQAGLISWDKKRGMKMVVTKCTEGWCPLIKRFYDLNPRT